jgi:hypothetical protein
MATYNLPFASRDLREGEQEVDCFCSMLNWIFGLLFQMHVFPEAFLVGSMIQLWEVFVLMCTYFFPVEQNSRWADCRIDGRDFHRGFLIG